MRLALENVNINNNGGPNSFARKLIHEFEKQGVNYRSREPEAILCFIESPRHDLSNIPLVQRLDGIYFNTMQPYDQQNANILRTYKAASGIVFQSEFSKNLVTTWFGEHENSTVIHNGANMDFIDSIPKAESESLSKFDNIWTCAASWRPHKRLKDNIGYFLQHSGPNDVLFVAGDKQDEEIPQDTKIKYLGSLNEQQLISLYKASTHFIHLGWLDNCPNVVVDARACGCHIICTNSGGTPEVAGPEATIIQQERWNFKPVELYSPPVLDFSKKAVNNTGDVDYNMDLVGQKYIDFCRSVLR
jgi:glycosyltransferase involved in cell wall biosynthesis